MSKRLPVELLHMIITYLTENDYRPIMKIRTICREWKDVGEHSIVWLKGRLFICAPKTFSKDFSSMMRNREFQIDEDITEIKIMYSVFYITNNKLVQLHSQSDIISPIHLQPQTLQLAYDVSQRFLEKYRLIHLAWRRFYSFYQLFHYFYRLKPHSSTLDKIHVINTAILGVAAFLFSSIPNRPSSLSLSEVFGFVCIYLNVGIHLTLTIVSCLGDIGQNLRDEIDLNILKLDNLLLEAKYSIDYILIINRLACLVSFALLQCSLSSENHISYTSVSIPLLSSTVIGIIVSFLTQFEALKIKILLSFCSISLSILLVGMYYDLPSHGGISSLGLTLIPLFPLALVLFIGSSYYIVNLIWYWRELIRDCMRDDSFRSRDYWSRVFLRLGPNFICASSLVMMFLLLFNLILKAFKDSLSLSKGLTSVVLMILFNQLLRLFQIYI